MALDPCLWQELELAGVTATHMKALRDFFKCQRHGRFEWHGRGGHLDHCELHLHFPSRAAELEQVRVRLLVPEE